MDVYGWGKGKKMVQKLRAAVQVANCAGNVLAAPKITAAKFTVGLLGNVLENGIKGNGQAVVNEATESCGKMGYGDTAIMVFWIIVAIVGFCFLLVVLSLLSRSKKESGSKKSTLDLLKLVV